MKKGILALAMVLALVGVLVMPMAALADNGADQSASTDLATTILIRNIGDNTTVASITFPSATGGSVVSNPSCDYPETQVLTATESEATPVAILTSTTAYNALWYNVTSVSAWGDVVASEKLYTIAIDGNFSLTTFGTNAYNMTVWGTDQETTQSLVANVDKELYLQVTLKSVAGLTGTSTLTVLGES